MLFQGTLHEPQVKAFEAFLPHDHGVLAATTAFGKTVVAAALIAQRGRNALVLVHRRELLTQWVERLRTFLDIDPKDVGTIGGGRRKPTGVIDVALIQSLVRRGEVSDLVADYGHLIVDECHHLSAASFELVARRAKARYVLGLSATVARKDGHHPIIFMQCGPVRHRVDAQAQTTSEGARSKAVACLLTERRDHLEYLQKRFSCFVRNLVVLRGGMSATERKVSEVALRAPEDQERLILATGRYLGEGFDDQRLDTLFLTMPFSSKGTLAQYVGRLHREHNGKTEVLVVDYVDEMVPVLARMAAKRRTGYRALGYTVE